MPEAPTPSNLQTPVQPRLREWVVRVEDLIRQISDWASAESWTVQRRDKSITERALGTYVVPELVVHLTGGELLVSPIALNVAGGRGRVDLEAIPTLSRIKLIAAPDGWQIWTDSNVPLRVRWDRENFTQLVRDLMA